MAFSRQSANVRSVPDLGHIRSRTRATKSGERTYWFIDWSPDLRGSDRHLRGIAGTPFSSRAEAEKTRKRVCGIVGDGKVPLIEAVERFRRPQVQRFLIERLAADWLAAVRVEISPKTGRALAPYTLAGYEAVIQHHLDFWSGLTIQDITARRLREWVAWMRGRGLAPHTIKNALVPIRGILRRYREDHPDLPEPVWPTIAVPRKQAQRMTLRDVIAAFDAIQEERIGVYLIAFYTTGRPGEARAALIEDYDFQTGKLRVGRALKTKSGKNRVEGAPKNDEVGVYELPEDLQRWIERWRGEARLDRTAPLAPNPETGEAWSHGRMAKWWRRACEDAEVPYVPLYRALKHSPGTALLEAGLSREDLQAAFRHRSVGTQLAYDVASDARRQRATGKLVELVQREREGPAAPGTSGAPGLEPAKSSEIGGLAGGRARIRTAEPRRNHPK